MKNIKNFDSFINEELHPDTYMSAAEKLKKKGHGKAIKRGTLFKKDLFGKVIAQALESGVGESYAIKAMIRKM